MHFQVFTALSVADFTMILLAIAYFGAWYAVSFSHIDRKAVNLKDKSN